MNQWNDESNQCNIESSLNWTLWDNESGRSSKWMTLIIVTARSNVEITRQNCMVIWVDVGGLWKCRVLIFFIRPSTLSEIESSVKGTKLSVSSIVQFCGPSTQWTQDSSLSFVSTNHFTKIRGSNEKIRTSTFSKIDHSHSNEHPVWSVNFHFWLCRCHH